jgi:hypothetical protein
LLRGRWGGGGVSGSSIRKSKSKTSNPKDRKGREENLSKSDHGLLSACRPTKLKGF